MIGLSGLTNIQLEVSEKIQLLADESMYTPLPLIDQIPLFKAPKRLISKIAYLPPFVL